ncbi:alpha/beta hydrolase [Alphaproteobacteria bacterium]|nr:alpha/beta hydrolase [Alphaproteobacteria bacterium]
MRDAVTRWFLFFPLLLALGACQAPDRNENPALTTPALSDDSLTMPDGASLFLQKWLPPEQPKAVILGLHGMNDYSRAFEKTGPSMAQKGLALFAYDQRGFGHSPTPGVWAGGEALANDAREALFLLSARYPKTPLYLMGQSMGGAVAMIAMTSPNPPAVSGVILIAPAVWDRRSMNLLQRASLWLLSRIAPGLTLGGGNLGVKASDNIEMLRDMSADPLVLKKSRVDAIRGLCDLMDAAQDATPRLTGPVLALYGEKDEVIPAPPTHAMMRKLPDGKTLALYENGWHMLTRDLDAQNVRNDIAAWIDNPSKPLPSGADQRARTVLGEPPPERGD